MNISRLRSQGVYHREKEWSFNQRTFNTHSRECGGNSRIRGRGRKNISYLTKFEYDLDFNAIFAVNIVTIQDDVDSNIRDANI